MSHRDIFICTITWIPGSGPGMTKAVVCFLFCEYCLCFGCGPGSPLGSRGGMQCRGDGIVSSCGAMGTGLRWGGLGAIFTDIVQI